MYKKEGKFVNKGKQVILMIRKVYIQKIKWKYQVNYALTI